MYAGGGAHGFRNRPEVTGSGPCTRSNHRNWCAQPTPQPVRSAPHAHACACASLQVFMLIARNPECAQRNRSAGVGLSGRCALCSAWHAQPRHACLHARAISLVSLRTDRPAHVFGVAQRSRTGFRSLRRGPRFPASLFGCSRCATPHTDAHVPYFAVESRGVSAHALGWCRCGPLSQDGCRPLFSFAVKNASGRSAGIPIPKIPIPFRNGTEVVSCSAHSAARCLELH